MKRYGSFDITQVGAIRDFGGKDRYVVSFITAYEGSHDPDDGFCSSPREAAEAGWALATSGYPVFVYDCGTGEMHRFECWGQESSKNGPSEGSVAGFYVAPDGDDEHPPTSFYRADGQLVSQEEAWVMYETLARFRSKDEADRFGRALQACGKKATTIHLCKAGSLAASPQA
jgi:hypothetical protein